MRNTTYYFPFEWNYTDCFLWLQSRGLDPRRMRVQWDGHCLFTEEQGSEQHERTANPMG